MKTYLDRRRRNAGEQPKFTPGKCPGGDIARLLAAEQLLDDAPGLLKHAGRKHYFFDPVPTNRAFQQIANRRGHAYCRMGIIK